MSSCLKQQELFSWWMLWNSYQTAVLLQSKWLLFIFGQSHNMWLKNTVLFPSFTNFPHPATMTWTSWVPNESELILMCEQHMVTMGIGVLLLGWALDLLLWASPSPPLLNYLSPKEKEKTKQLVNKWKLELTKRYVAHKDTNISYLIAKGTCMTSWLRQVSWRRKFQFSLSATKQTKWQHIPRSLSGNRWRRKCMASKFFYIELFIVDYIYCTFCKLCMGLNCLFCHNLLRFALHYS